MTLIAYCRGFTAADRRAGLAELAIGNIVRRVLHMIREEAQQVRFRLQTWRALMFMTYQAACQARLDSAFRCSMSLFQDLHINHVALGLCLPCCYASICASCLRAAVQQELDKSTHLQPGQPTDDVARAKRPGLLSKALQSIPAMRAVSLHNLLDQSAFDALLLQVCKCMCMCMCARA